LNASELIIPGPSWRGFDWILPPRGEWFSIKVTAGLWLRQSNGFFPIDQRQLSLVHRHGIMYGHKSMCSYRAKRIGFVSFEYSELFLYQKFFFAMWFLEFGISFSKVFFCNVFSWKSWCNDMYGICISYKLLVCMGLVLIWYFETFSVERVM
jgi:hypothetical protein